MTQQSIGIFLPCRQGSQRVPLKNINPIGKYTLGLFEIKIRQLLAIPNIEIYLSTDDKIIIDYVSEHLNNNRVKVFIRDPFLASATTSTDDLVMHAHELVQADHILWTHVTSPFITIVCKLSKLGSYPRTPIESPSLSFVCKTSEYLPC